MRWSIGRNGFRGMRLRRDTRYTGFPVSVVDAKLMHGDLRPFPCPEEKCDVGGVNTVVSTIAHINNNDCCSFEQDTRYFEDCDLIYWNDETGTPQISTLQQFCNGTGCDYGVQCPAGAPSIVSFESAPSAASTASCNSHFFAYRYSYIVEIGGREFEGHWSPPSTTILADATPNAVLGNIPNPGGCHTRVRVYRAASGNHSGQGTESEQLGGWFVVGDFGFGASYVDNRSYSSLQRKNPISPDEFGSPPANIRSLGITDNGVHFGIDDQCIMFTIPGLPMTWGPRRKICLPKNAGKPVLAVARGNDVYVYTDKKPVFLRAVISQSGIGFEMIVVQKQLPLVSVASATTGYAGEYFASNDGYYIWNETRIDNLTNDWFGYDDWCALDPSSISGAIIDDHLIFSTSVDAFMLTFGDRLSQINDQNSGSNLLVGLNLQGTMIGATAHVLDCNGKLRFHNNGMIYCWDLCSDITPKNHKDQPLETGENPCCPWTYCDFVDIDQCANLTRGEIKFDIRTLVDGITLRFYTVECEEPTLLKEVVVDDCKSFTLPACTPSEQYFFEATGCETTKHFSFASSLFELADSPLPDGKVTVT